MATRSGTFTAANQVSAILALGAGESATLTLTKIGGTFSARVEERIGEAFIPFGATHTTDQSALAYFNTSKDIKYLRVICLEASGTSVAYSLADVAGEDITQVKNDAGTVVFAVSDRGIETPRVDTTDLVTSTLNSGAATFTSTVAMAAIPTVTDAAAGAAAGSNTTAVTTGNDGGYPTTITFAARALTVTDALAYAGTKVFDFPPGRIRIESCSGSLQFGHLVQLVSGVR